SPVVKVKYEIVDTRVGQKTNYDRLVLEIWTNGTTSPQLALVEAAKILRKHLNPFVQYSEPGPEVSIDDRPDSAGGSHDSELERKLAMSLAELELSVRATNCLETEGITTVRDLVTRSEAELLEVRNFGETTLKEVKQKLSERGLELGQRIPGALRR
ncbi:MAG: DNA-directed RNA polymerase subunit alpha C-terminal domain-containing protein, partial [Planctomycetota bacterium]